MQAVSPSVEEVVREAVHVGEVPGAVAIVGRRDHRGEAITAGVAKEGGPATTPETRYDLASLTKVVATLPCITRLLSDGELSLDDRVGRFIRNAGWYQAPSLAEITIRELLTHTSGLAHWRPVFAWASDRQTAFANVLQSPIEHRGTIVYSDLGFMVLGAIIERVSGLRQDVFAARHVFGPLGMGAGYGPITGVPVAATEDCGWRNTLLEGVVHDENAFRADGVAGHAGLFGTAGDLATYAQAWLRLDARLGDEAVLSEAVREQVANEDGRYGLAWRLKGADSFSGSRSTRAGYGHTGFSGTSIWIEPDQGWFAVLLTNRIHPSRDRGPHMHQLRRRFHDAASAEMTG